MSLPLPRIYLIQTNLNPEELQELEQAIPTLTYDVNEAEVVLGRVSRRQRAQFELRRLKLETEPTEIGLKGRNHTGDDTAEQQSSKCQKMGSSDLTDKFDNSLVRVLNLSWFTESIERGELLPMSNYIVYEGRKIGRTTANLSSSQATSRPHSAENILKRAADDLDGSETSLTPLYKRKGNVRIERSHPPGSVIKRSLIRQTTSEHDISLPPIPDFLHTTYSCQRPTPVNPPNVAFIEELKNIRTLRLLQGDRIGEWHATGHTAEMETSAADPKVGVLRIFYDIWGVGDVNARDFYQKGWRDLDDIVEYGWQSLSRVQQIGVKYYEDFQKKIGRNEVSSIADVILDHAHRLDQGFEMKIVGGYRRGREESGDVDVILTHREESKTFNFVEPLVLSLEKNGYITHTLSLSKKNSERGQKPLPWKGEGSTWGTGFDTLDKAMVVWLNKQDANALHRRVDIIVSPWKTVGCAILGWSGETTFQRDLRRYCKKEKGFKFDSSGIRNRTDGSWIDIEGGNVTAGSMEDAERRVFAGLGIPWRPPSERCTG
ncbi:hypothetical protein NLG97_g558 [Lecanicillium saksenae]|uniref:Uncharacterized protein n=1 Tax=Lecanicillium saksenae TaxID=468837 RepID=A0ACC1R7L5_9HYPO|nr:hypothetical protein NLG97_g558 [Lecanicillium saksenae]